MKKHAFTTVEVIIVIAIIGLLVAIVIPAFIKANNQSHLNKLKLSYNQNLANPIIWDPETLLVVELDKNWEKINAIVGVIKSPSIETFKSLSLDGQKLAIKPITSDFLAKYPFETLLRYVNGDNPSKAFLTDIYDYRFSNHTSVSIDPIPVAVAVARTVTEKPVPYPFKVKGGQLEINYPDITSPKSIIYNGVEYVLPSEDKESNNELQDGVYPRYVDKTLGSSFLKVITN